MKKQVLAAVPLAMSIALLGACSDESNEEPKQEEKVVNPQKEKQAVESNTEEYKTEKTTKKDTEQNTEQASETDSKKTSDNQVLDKKSVKESSNVKEVKLRDLTYSLSLDVDFKIYENENADNSDSDQYYFNDGTAYLCISAVDLTNYKDHPNYKLEEFANDWLGGGGYPFTSKTKEINGMEYVVGESDEVDGEKLKEYIFFHNGVAYNITYSNNIEHYQDGLSIIDDVFNSISFK